MTAKVKLTQRLVDVECTDSEPGNIDLWSYRDKAGGNYLRRELDFEDLCDYKSWAEDLIHDIAVEAYKKGVPEEERKRTANDIVLFAYAVCDRMAQESKTWR